MTIAGHALPALSAGFLIRNPIFGQFEGRWFLDVKPIGMKERGLDIYKRIAMMHRNLNCPALLSSVSISYSHWH